MGVYKGYIEFLSQHWVNEELKRVKAINYDSHTQRSDNVIVLKAREKIPRDEICAKTSVERKTTTPGNSIYTSLTTFPVLVHLLSYYDWVPATCNIHTRHPGVLPTITVHPIRGGSARKRYLIRALGIWSGRDFTIIEVFWKGRKISLSICNKI